MILKQLRPTSTNNQVLFDPDADGGPKGKLLLVITNPTSSAASYRIFNTRGTNPTYTEGQARAYDVSLAANSIPHMVPVDGDGVIVVRVSTSSSLTFTLETMS